MDQGPLGRPIAWPQTRRREDRRRAAGAAAHLTWRSKHPLRTGVCAGSSSCEVPWETRHTGSSVTPVSEPPDPTLVLSGGLVSSGRGRGESQAEEMSKLAPSLAPTPCNGP